MRSLRDPALYVIAATMLCGIANVHVWFAVPAAVIGLQAMSLPRYLQMFAAARDAGAEAQWWRVVGLSVGFAILVAGGAFVLGRVVSRVSGF